LFRLATSERFERTVKAAPGGDAQAWRAASRYVAGRSRDEALIATFDLLAQGHGVSVDLFGELVRDQATADRVTEDYLALAAALPIPPADVWLSLDLSHLAIDTDPVGAADRLATVAEVLPPGRRIQVGAEDAARTDAGLGCVLDVAGRGLANHVGATVQANLLRSERDVDILTAAGVHVWQRTTVDCGKRCCSRSARCRSSSCSECAQRYSTSSRRERCRPGSTCRTDPTGFATGSAESPNPAAPDLRSPYERPEARLAVGTHGITLGAPRAPDCPDE